MVSPSQVIDTGRSLSRDVRVKVAPATQGQSADITPTATQSMIQTMQNVDIPASTHSKVLSQSATPKQEVHFTFQDGLVEVYTSHAGQTYLTVKPVIVFVVIGVLVLAVFLKLAVLFAKQKKVAELSGAEVVIEPQFEPLLEADMNEISKVVPQTSSRPKIRRLTL